MPLSTGQEGTTTSRVLNKLQSAVSNVAADITTATTSDIVLMFDASANYAPKYADATNVLELIGTTATAAELTYLDITTLGTGAASKAVVLDSGDDYTWPATGILTYGVLKDPAGSTLGATVAEINNAADVSARVEEHTGSGAVTAGVQSVEINSVAAAALTIASADAHQGLFIVKHTSSSNGQNHTLTLTSGTYDGTNTVALLDAANEALVVYFDSNGAGTIVENVGSVSLG